MKRQSCKTEKPDKANGTNGKEQQCHTNTPLIIGIILIFGSIIFGALIWRSYSNKESEETNEAVNEESSIIRSDSIETETTIPKADSIPS